MYAKLRGRHGHGSGEKHGALGACGGRPPLFCDAPASGPELADAGKRIASLTQPQSRILTLICESKLNKQTAFDLSIAETTVKAHMTAIMRKLGVQSRTQAVLVAQAAQFGGILPKH
jgi:DNA-binding NarL/FixJ family response regulator